MIDFLDLFLHLDKHLGAAVRSYGGLVYAILFLTIFGETGLVVAPFLPGDSLLFAAGAFAAIGSLQILPLFILFAIAAILGDTVNYHLGYFFGAKVFSEKGRILSTANLKKTQQFYEQYG